MAVVDDYLAVRPEAEADAAAASRRRAALAMGPWYILMDEFLVSGETIVRDLQLGLERAAAFGGAMEVGYLPDMFGHIAQMPQILRQFGFDHAVVWRGVPGAVDRTGVLVVERPTARRCGPSTCPPATATAPPSPTTPRSCSSDRASAIDDAGSLHRCRRPDPL